MYTKLDQLPAESLLQILGYLDINTLLELKVVNSTIHAIVTYLLFKQKNPSALGYQIAWCEYILFNNDVEMLPEHVDLLLQTMQKPELTIENKINGLAKIAAFKHRKLKVSERHFNKLNEYLLSDNEETRLSALQLLTCIYPYLTPEQSDLVLNAALDKAVSSLDFRIYIPAIKILELMIPEIPLNSVGLLFTKLVNNFNAEHFQLKKNSLEIAAFMGPRLTSEQITLIFPLIEDSIGDKGNRKCDAAHRAVSGMAIGFSAKQRMTILKKVMPKVEQSTQGKEVRTALCDLTKNLERKQKTTIYKKLLKGLKHKNELMRASSIESLSAILANLAPEQMKDVIEELTDLFDDQNEVIRTSALRTLPEIVQFLNLGQLNNIMDRIARLLTEEDSICRFNALDTLEALGTRLSLDSIEPILPLVLKCLDDNHEDNINNQSKALDVLTALTAKLSSEWIRPVFKPVIQKFLSNYSLAIPAMKTLAALGSQLDNQQVSLIFEELKHRVYRCDVAKTTLIAILPVLNNLQINTFLIKLTEDLECARVNCELTLKGVLNVFRILMPQLSYEKAAPFLSLATPCIDHDNNDVKEIAFQLLISASIRFPQEYFNFIKDRAFSMVFEENHYSSHYALEFLQTNISLLESEQQSLVMYVLLNQLDNSDVNFQKKTLSLLSAAIASSQLSIDKMDNDLNSPHMTLLQIFSEWHNYIQSLQRSQQSLILSSLGNKFFDRRPPSNGTKEDKSKAKAYEPACS